MSLLEDVFLEDEAGEAQELERVIEGDEFDERPRTPNSNDDSEKEDEAEEDKRRVDHTAKAKKVVKNPRFVLNPARLTGPRGIQIIPDHFKDFKFKGKGHEKEDLDQVLKKLEHWAYRLYPKFKFDDCLKKIETLGKKRPVMVHLHKIRTDQYTSDETVVQQDSSGDEAPAPEEDEFDRLLQQQIEIARSTPAPGSVRKELHTPVANRSSPLLAPKVISSPSISDEQKERMMRNRKLAEERRLAKLNQLNSTANNSTENIKDTESRQTVEKTDIVSESNNIVKDDDIIQPVIRKHNRSNIIDSSDEENDIIAVNESITVHVHNKVQIEDNSDKENIETEDITDESEIRTSKLDNDEILNDNGVNIKDTVIESTNHQAMLGNDSSEVNEVKIHKDNTEIENEPVLDKVETAVDADKTNTEDKEKYSVNDKVSTKDLMDIDFSNDF